MPNTEKQSSQPNPLLTDDGFKNHFGVSKAEMPNEVKRLFYDLSLHTSKDFKQQEDFDNDLFLLKQLDEFFSKML